METQCLKKATSSQFTVSPWLRHEMARGSIYSKNQRASTAHVNCCFRPSLGPLESCAGLGESSVTPHMEGASDTAPLRDTPPDFIVLSTAGKGPVRFFAPQSLTKVFRVRHLKCRR